MFFLCFWFFCCVSCFPSDGVVGDGCLSVVGVDVVCPFPCIEVDEAVSLCGCGWFDDGEVDGLDVDCGVTVDADDCPFVDVGAGDCGASCVEVSGVVGFETDESWFCFCSPDVYVDCADGEVCVDCPFDSADCVFAVSPVVDCVEDCEVDEVLHDTAGVVPAPPFVESPAGFSAVACVFVVPEPPSPVVGVAPDCGDDGAFLCGVVTSLPCDTVVVVPTEVTPSFAPCDVVVVSAIKCILL
ncbi:hypothetical protein EHI_014810 [Entamoeba histolytica HM-1:IMSS]|uniref:Uncharacterized protein n=4 Tax=Entamoeba histolytica TaxID=5759 RepID=C4MBB7_ENTH1|nr:hypothetical protein EHI_014810 [Entamoeba histolytica HM-1:IMSS]EAL42933.2 hypothetical protein EHI_014810 [Entamoeba histolytica HM-1:IMSS]EMD46531.1 Hypothetical protein EHI5A_275850 [Entamoeba histolytica KU27]|eukprot:XP_648319.2 hypothetical protein EHI_014810 [Entamoeba histolytica HM-1:IMSS]